MLVKCEGGSSDEELPGKSKKKRLILQRYYVNAPLICDWFSLPTGSLTPLSGQVCCHTPAGTEQPSTAQQAERATSEPAHPGSRQNKPETFLTEKKKQLPSSDPGAVNWSWSVSGLAAHRDAASLWAACFGQDNKTRRTGPEQHVAYSRRPLKIYKRLGFSAVWFDFIRHFYASLLTMHFCKSVCLSPSDLRWRREERIKAAKSRG